METWKRELPGKEIENDDDAGKIASRCALNAVDTHFRALGLNDNQLYELDHAFCCTEIDDKGKVIITEGLAKRRLA